MGGGDGGASGEVDKYKALTKQLTAEVAALEEDITTAEDENEALAERCKELMEANAELEAVAAAANKRAAAAATAPAHASMTRNASEAGEVAELRAELATAVSRATVAEEAQAELEGALIEAKMAAAQAAFEAETLHGDKRALAKQLAKAKLAYNALSERITELEVQSIR